jgi:hypothetical protein
VSADSRNVKRESIAPVAVYISKFKAGATGIPMRGTRMPMLNVPVRMDTSAAPKFTVPRPHVRLYVPKLISAVLHAISRFTACVWAFTVVAMTRFVESSWRAVAENVPATSSDAEALMLAEVRVPA